MKRLKKGRVKTIAALLTEIKSYVTDIDIHGTEAWEILQDKPFPYGIVLKAPGLKEDTNQYIQLMYNEVRVGTTYDQWFKTSLETSSYWQNPDYQYVGPISAATDIFKVDANIISFSVNKQFSAGLQFHEQGGKVEFNTKFPVKLIPNRRYFKGSTTPTYINPPIYPGTCVPTLALDLTSQEKLYNSEYDYWIEYWILKSKCSVSISICIMGKYWQSISLGLLDSPTQTTRPFPAYIAGGTTGLTPGGYSFYSSVAMTATGITGLWVDYTLDNYSLSNGMAINACKAQVAANEDYGVSNVLAIQNDGQWEWYGNFRQWVDVTPAASCGNFVLFQMFPLSRPLRETRYNVILPNNTDISDLTNFDGGQLDLTNPKLDYTLWPIMLMSGPSKVSEYRGATGSPIPNHYMVSGTPICTGEGTVKGRNYLFIPNGWDSRSMYWPPIIGIFNKWDSKELEADEIARERFSRNMAYMAIDITEE